MKILVATDQWAPDVIGGSARVATDSARALARRGHEVVVIAPSQPHLPAVDLDDGLEIRRVLRRGSLPQTLADPVTSMRHTHALRHRSFDVLVGHQPTTAVGLTAGGVDAPLALVFHASLVLEMRFARSRLTGRRRTALHVLGPVFAGLERRAVRRAARILVLSSFSERLVRDLHPCSADRVRVVGGGVGDQFFSKPNDPAECRARLGIPEGILLFTARRLEPRMGVDVLIDAVSKIDDDQVVLAIAGSGLLEQDLARRIRTLGLDDRIRLLGRVSEEDLRSLYAAADLFVMPTVAYEGFGMSTVEALAAGTPVIGTDVGATPELIDALGQEFVVPPADVEALADAVRRVIPTLGADLRERARSLASEHYRWDGTIEAWEKALLETAR